VDISRSCWSCSAAITVVGCRYIFLTETATNVVRVVARCATTDGGMWVGLVSDLAPRSHSRRIAHRLVGGEVALPRSGPSVYSVQRGHGREWKSEKWWIALLPIATRTIDRYPLEPRGQGAGTSPGAVHTRAWAGVRGGNRPPRRQAHPGAPSLPRGAPKGRHNRHFQPAAGGKSEMGRNVFPSQTSHARNSQYGPLGGIIPNG
jgi:hypothetical protein